MEFSRYTRILTNRNCSDYDRIFSVAFPLYDCFNTSEEIIKTSTLIVDNVLIYNPLNYFERAVIATLSYFVDNHFKIATNPNHLDDPNLQPGIPQNWQDVISTSIVNNLENRVSAFFVRKNTQTYDLMLSSVCCIDSNSGTVSVLLVHTGNHREFTTGLHSSEVNGLTDNDRAYAVAFGTHIIKKLTKAMDLPVKKAAKDQAPSTPMSPI